MAYEFKFPDVGEGIAEGELVEWIVKEGDDIKEHDPIAKVETDKAVVDIPSPKSGKILKLNFKEGETVKVGETLAVIGEEGEKVEETKEKKIEEKKEVKEEIKEEPKKEKRKTTSVVGDLEESDEEFKVEETKKETKEKKKVLATPSIRKLAKELNVDISTLEGTGQGGRVVEEDIKKASKGEVPVEIEEKKEIKVTKKYDLYGYVDRIPLKGIRKTIADNMMRAVNEVAHVTSMDEIDITELSDVRKVQKEVAEKKGIKLTFLPYIIKALIHAIKSYPIVNSSIQGEEIIIKKYYNFGIAVDTENGLIVPVVKGVDQKGILDLAKEIKELADKTKERKVDLGDLKGGTFTITNYGSIGGSYGTPIVNYPEAAILGLGRAKDIPRVVDGKIVIRKILPISVTFDHRIFDGATTSRFMNELKKYLEDPSLSIVED
ncbi:MAG: dihydrolipoamide acetyltransferase family protein [Candidatus Nanoarchaeia archaeon]|jgi:pyruvate dehydrogenase E2 component (dihydrolipoamide acetyltransferase)|nr:dihydrolipoamide acetyltransferase family protein [Candidatus Nanoarchaeia archaeon]|tara:strand:+ start:10835 stop:12136 length:1302 start_codon:yes stop_codon:yes gene_type:complete